MTVATGLVHVTDLVEKRVVGLGVTVLLTNDVDVTGLGVAVTVLVIKVVTICAMVPLTARAKIPRKMRESFIFFFKKF